jgi:acetyl-CoA acetyltransferase
LSDDVWIVGISMTKFMRYKDKDLIDLASDAALDALDDGGVTIQDMDILASGNLAEAAGGVGQRIQKQIGQTGIPVYNVANACATGATAFKVVHTAIKAGEASIGLASLDGKVRDPNRRRARRAGVEDVVGLDAGLADLLLDALGDHAVGLVGVADGEHLNVLDRQASVGERVKRRPGSQVDQVAVLVPTERRHRRPDDPGRFTTHQESCSSCA